MKLIVQGHIEYDDGSESQAYAVIMQDYFFTDYFDCESIFINHAKEVYDHFQEDIMKCMSIN